MKEETSVVTNGSVTILATRVYSFSKFNRNAYKRNDVDVPSYELTSVERGHIYTAEALKDDRIHITSLRICDNETLPLVAGLASLKNEDEGIKSGRFSTQCDHSKALIYNFSLTVVDWALFKQRVEKFAGLAELEAASREEVTLLTARLTELLTDACDLAQICRESFEELQNYAGDDLFEDIATLLEQLDELQLHQVLAGKVTRKLRRQQELAKSVKSGFLTALTGGALGAASKRMQVIKKAANPTAMQTQLQKLLEDSTADSDIVRKAFPLGTEIAWLKKYYPVLDGLSIRGDKSLAFTVEVEGVGALTLLVTNNHEVKLKADEKTIGRLLKGQNLRKGAAADSRFGSLDLDE